MNFYREMAQRLSRQPGVSGVTYQRMALFTGGEWDEDFSDTRGTDHDTWVNAVAPAYFSTMRIPLLAGREFTWNDTPPSNQAVGRQTSGFKIILNQTAARQLFPDGNALGRSIRHDEGKQGVRVYEVVGIVGDAKYNDLHATAPPTAYLAITQRTGPDDLSYIAEVRTTGAAASLVGAVRAIAAEMAPQVPAPEVVSLESVIDDSLGAERMMTLLAVFFAVCALVVTAIGLYGTLAYATARRTAEIGIRMALGARRAQVAAMVFGQNLWVVMGGTVAGVAVALIATRALTSFLFSTSAHDPWVIGGSICALALTACAASLLPAVRAAGIEPMSAIRCE
jgi:predicted permease